MCAYAHPVASEKQMCTLMFTTSVWRTHLHMHGAQQRLWMHLHSPKKTHMQSCMRAYAAVQKLLCHESYCEFILSLARASCSLSFAAHQPAGSTKSVAWRCSLKKSVQIHASSWCGRRCGVAQTSSDHLRWCRPHPVCLSVALALGHGVYLSQKSIFAIFRASLFEGNRKGDISQSCGQSMSNLETNIDIALEEFFLLVMHLIWCHGARQPVEPTDRHVGSRCVNTVIYNWSRTLGRTTSSFLNVLFLVTLSPFLLSLLLFTPSFSAYMSRDPARCSSTWAFTLCVYVPLLPS